MTHKHICGDTGASKGSNGEITVDLTKGCGYIYSHSKSKKHLCPKCKASVTRSIYRGEPIVYNTQ